MLTSAIFRPGKTMRGLLKTKHPARRALLAVGAVGFLFIVTSAVLAVAGASPTAPVFFGMDVGNYYFWQMIFVLPLIMAVWLVTAGVIRILDGREKDRPGFGGTAALAGIALSPALFLAWVPSAVEAGFMAFGMGQVEWVDLFSKPGPWQTVYLAFYAFAVLRAGHGFILAACLLRRKPGAGSIIAGIAAAAVPVGAYIIFIR